MPNKLEEAGINWVIIGAQSPYSVKTFPKWEWVKEIIDAADKAGMPYFEKNNLQRGLNRALIQQFPKLVLQGMIWT